MPPGRRLGVNLAHFDRVRIESLVRHRLAQHVERPLPGGALTPPEKLDARRRSHASQASYRGSFAFYGSKSESVSAPRRRAGDEPPGARPTGFEPVTFGFVDRSGSSVELVWAQDSALYRDSSSSGFGWIPSCLLPSCGDVAVELPRRDPGHREGTCGDGVVAPTVLES